MNELVQLLFIAMFGLSVWTGFITIMYIFLHGRIVEHKKIPELAKWPIMAAIAMAFSMIIFAAIFLTSRYQAELIINLLGH